MSAHVRFRPPIAVAVIAVLLSTPIYGQVRLLDESDRSAFRSWFVLLADAQFERQTADVIDCAALVRHAFREALRAHTPEWVRQSGLPFAPRFADVRSGPRATTEGWPLFRVTDGPSPKYAEFADARTLIRLNARGMGRSVSALRPGDLLYFHQPGQKSPDHLMVFVGRSHFETDGDDWVVYHTGPIEPGGSVSAAPPAAGEVRKVRLSTLVHHPSARWRPLTSNPQFIGVYRLAVL